MNMEPGRIRRGNLSGHDTIEIRGPFDFANGELEVVTREILQEQKKTAVFDLRRASYLTSTGIAGIVKVVKRFQAIGGTVYVTGTTGDMMELIKLAKLDKYVQFI